MFGLCRLVQIDFDQTLDTLSGFERKNDATIDRWYRCSVAVMLAETDDWTIGEERFLKPSIASFDTR